MSETILSERTNKCLKVVASPARSLSVVSGIDVNFWSLLPGLPDDVDERSEVIRRRSGARGDRDASYLVLEELASLAVYLLLHLCR